MIPKMPVKVKRCVTHHYACTCREWKYEQMEKVLKVIHVWACAELEISENLPQATVMNLRNIADMAYKAVHCLGKARNEEKYCEIAAKRIEQEAAQLKLFREG